MGVFTKSITPKTCKISYMLASNWFSVFRMATIP